MVLAKKEKLTLFLANKKVLEKSKSSDKHLYSHTHHLKWNQMGMLSHEVNKPFGEQVVSKYPEE